MSIVIFHPSVAPFVQHAAHALEDAGLLERFYTTLRDNPESRWQRIACSGAHLAGFDLRGNLRRRAVTEVPAQRVTSFPLRELVRLATGAIDRSGRLTDSVWEWAEVGFDRKVARQLRPGVGGVYGFEHSSLATFERAHQQGIPSIYDVPAPETEFVQRLLAQEMDRFPSLRTSYHVHTAAREARRTERRRAEWRTADLVIANSEYTRGTYLAAGLDTRKVRVVPYGAPPPVSREAAVATSSANRRLQLIWAGTFSIRKGAHYVLEAWRRRGFGAHASLWIHGSMALPDSLLSSLPPGIEVRGSIPRARLMEIYGQADALLFPTLCDGFGLVVTEAFSRGLPVITTTSAGAADLIRDKANGLLIKPADAEAIAGAIEWCLANRSTLQAMREPALATAAARPWSQYRRELMGAIGAFGLSGRPTS